MELEIYQVDAFTSEPFKGNPAGVCITDTALNDDLMLSIAAEMALPETAFLSLDDFNLRWFTPTVEVKLCGHGLLRIFFSSTITFNRANNWFFIHYQESWW